MILPTTASAVWILAIVSLLCLGSWANTLKVAGKWRFEYYYYDFVFGIVLIAGLAALLLGSARPQELTFQDNLLLAGYRKMAWAFGSGVVLNLGILLLLAAMTVSGMSVAFPVALGSALVIGTMWDYMSTVQSNAGLTWAGMILFVGAVVVAAMSHIWRRRMRKTSERTPPTQDPRVKAKRPKAPSAAPAIILAVVSGIALSIFPRVLAEGTTGDNGLSPYSALGLLAVAAFLSSPFFVLFFTTFPIVGAAGKMGGYLTGTKMQHLLGVGGGMLWGAGMLSSLLMAVAPRGVLPGGLILYSLSNGAVVVAAAWGVFVWREFREAGERTRMLVTGMMVLFLAGLGLVGFAFSTPK
jgi:glucose uptake protein